MVLSAGSGRTLSQFALVSYIPGPLAEFLDQLRLNLTPGCNPRAHVTVLPPRPLAPNADLRSVIGALEEESRQSTPIEITLGEIDVFPVTEVIYLSIARGERELHALHENLNFGQLEYDGPYPFHPHVTVAQNLEQDRLKRFTETARLAWKDYSGPRSFLVESLSFVQNIAPNMWLDVAKMSLAVPVGVTK